MKLDKLTIVLGALLFLSLSANMFMAGLMIGHSVEAGTPPREAAGKSSADGRADEWKQRDQQIQKKLSAEDRAVVEAAKAKDGPQILALRQALKDAHGKVEAAQAAEPFDQAAVDDALKEEAAAKSALVKAMRAARQNVLEKLSPEGRETVKAFAPWKKQGARGQRRVKDDNDSGRPALTPEGDAANTAVPAPENAPTPPPSSDTYGQSPPPPAPPQPAPAQP